jgi:CO/xanthine dehydrogenase Mo-binding subunit
VGRIAGTRAMSVKQLERSPATDIFRTNEIRVEGRDKVSGKAQYTADVHKPNALWAAFAVSPYAHANIVRIDTSAAKAVAGVKAVLTGTDIGGVRTGRMISDWSVLAHKKVVYIGDRVAAVAAETREAAQEAARLIEIEYEELPPVIDPARALDDDAPVIHPDFDAYAYNSKARPVRRHPNQQGGNVIRKGTDAELDAIFSKAHRVFEHSYSTPRQHCGYLEPRSTLVWVDDDGTIHVVTPNKSPFKLRDFMAAVSGTPKNKIVVESVTIGGDFGGKGLTVDEFPCYFLAKATGRPVRYVSNYVDELQNGTVRHPSHLTLRTAVDRDGTFLAHHSYVLFNGGAYGGGKPGNLLTPGQIGYSTVGYRIPNVRLDIDVVYTNTTPAAHMRAPSDVQIFWAWEQHVEEIAAALGIDSLALRMRNVVVEGDRSVSDESLYKPAGRAVLETLAGELAKQGPPAPGTGRGISLVCRHTGGGKTSIKASLKASGTVEVIVGAPDQGAGGFTVVCRIVAGILGIPPENVAVRRGTTDEAALDPGTGASRVTHIVGAAAIVAANAIVAELSTRSAMRFVDGAFVDAAGVRQPFASVAATACAGGSIDVVGSYDGSHEGDHPADYTFSSYAIDVAVDAETGAFTILDTLFITDVGQIISPVGHQGQIDGGFIYGLGGATMEEMPLDESGKVTTLSLGDYKLPTINDLPPPFRTVHVQAEGQGPYGAKMAGELSNSGVAPALINAIYNAVGVRLAEFPITSERIYRALQSRSEHARPFA